MTDKVHLDNPHYPGRALVDAYGDGGFRFAGMSHRGSLICLPVGIYAWSQVNWDDVSLEDFTFLDGLSDSIEVFLLGCGPELRIINEKMRQWFRDRQIIAESMTTGAAARTYNVLMSENRQVGAALLAVE